MYVLLSVIISFESWFDNAIKMRSRIGWFILGILLLAGIYFISSRAGILAVIILIPFYALNKIIKLRKGRFIWISVLVILILALPLIRKNDRVNYFISGFSREQKLELRQRDDRIIIWESAGKIIKRNLLIGVGIGDVRNELVKEYGRIGEEGLKLGRYNTHNQFVEVLLENGMIGLLLFLILFGFMIFISFSEKNLLYGLFILIVSIFFMFETVLYRLAGISFFSLFSFLLLYVDLKKDILKC
jgi:O-antigen ligase